MTLVFLAVPFLLNACCNPAALVKTSYTLCKSEHKYIPDLRHKLSWQLNFKRVAAQGHGTAVRLLIMLACMATCKFSGRLQSMFR